jgi:hypothetical protein
MRPPMRDPAGHPCDNRPAIDGPDNRKAAGKRPKSFA